MQQHRKELAYLGSQMNKPGYLDEVKSLVSEFMQYDIREENLAEMKEKAKDQPLLEMKLKDVGILYQSFREFLKGHYMTGEEVMDVLLKQLPFSEKLKGAEFLFDGFTGFTPIQVNVLRELLVIADRISVTVTMDEREDAFSPGKPYQLFFMSKQMIRTLAGLTRDLEDPVYLKPSGQSRFAQAPALQFLEKNIFRYRKGVYAEEQQEIKIFTAPSPLEEMREAARRMSELVRTCGYRYGEIAVITGNLEEYARLAAQVFEEADIPYFIDEKHSVMILLWSICALPWRWRYRDFLMRVFSVISDAGCQKLPENRLISWRITCWRWESGDIRNGLKNGFVCTEEWKRRRYRN